MKRMHIHIAVTDLQQNIAFYTALLQCRPLVVEDDYAKWMLDDPCINLAISSRGRKPGLDHLGIQVDSESALVQMQQNMHAAALPVIEQKQAACCYTESDKYWTLDPQGIPWESFHTLQSIPVFGHDANLPTDTAPSCCSPASGCCSD